MLYGVEGATAVTALPEVDGLKVALHAGTHFDILAAARLTDEFPIQRQIPCLHAHDFYWWVR